MRITIDHSYRPSDTVSKTVRQSRGCASVAPCRSVSSGMSGKWAGLLRELDIFHRRHLPINCVLSDIGADPSSSVGSSWRAFRRNIASQLSPCGCSKLALMKWRIKCVGSAHNSRLKGSREGQTEIIAGSRPLSYLAGICSAASMIG